MKIKFLLLTAIMLFIVSGFIFAQSFTEIPVGLPGVANSSVAWGDYDNDDDLDILLTGDGISKVYRNDGGGVFTDINAGLQGVDNSSVAWGDYDNDGDLDILLAGSGICKVYCNDGGGVFTDINSGLPGVASGSIAWGDYDNDGDLDILLTGWGVSKIYRNLGGGVFRDINAGLPGVSNSSVAWGDYDNDGDLDILLTGQSTSIYISKIYRNDGGGIFTDINAGLPGVETGSVAWGDYDNDGDLDILLTGYNDGPFISKVYRNNGGGVFTDINAGLTGVAYSSVAWGDYDNDGDLDILLIGVDENDALTKLYRNDGGGLFTDIIAGIPYVTTGSVAWGDYDNDGDLDILLTGYTGFSHISKVYRNNCITVNTPPNTPTGITATSVGNIILFKWNKTNDEQTAQNALTYNLRVGTTVGGVQVCSPMADVLSGYRKLPQIGNTNHDTTWIINLIEDGTYYYSVQAIDNAFAGSAFSTEQSIVIEGPLPPFPPTLLSLTPEMNQIKLKWTKNTEADVIKYRIYCGTSPSPITQIDSTSGVDDTVKTITGLTNGIRYYFRVTAVDSQLQESYYSNELNATPTNFIDIDAGLSGVEFGSCAWGDYDNDGDLDILLNGYTGLYLQTNISKVYRNNGDGTFTDINAGLQVVQRGSVAWGDYDNDGDLDILLTGINVSTVISKVYRNDGGGVFTDINAGLPGVQNSSVAWGDYDNDGDLDILLTGYDGPIYSHEKISKVYGNDGNGVFTDVNAGLTGIGDGSVAWGDYDNDGDLDILLTGNTGSTYISKIYRNDGNGVFTDINAGLTGVAQSSVAWGDYDNDGDLDILLSGNTGAPYVSKVYRNDGNGVFTDISAGLPGVKQSSVAWGDYDNDGDLDILFNGNVHPQNISAVYRNDGGGVFTDINAGLTGVASGSVAWGDYDNDGDLDILFTGYSGYYTYFSKVYRNDIETINTKPTSPTNLVASKHNNSISLSWNKSTDNQTPQNSLTYNVRIGSNQGGVDIFSPMSNIINGFRKVPKLGNTNHNNNWQINNLKHGTYYWSVQAIDNSFVGSNFAIEDSVVLKGTLSGLKFNDINKNGIKDNNERGIANWKIKMGGARTDSTFTDSYGKYNFDNLEIGTYYISENDSSDWERTYPSPNDKYTILITDSIFLYDSLDFGNHQLPPKVKIKLTVHDNSISSERNIYFGVKSGATFGIWGVSQQATNIDSIEDEFELPPVMGDIFDARFTNPRGGTSLFGRGSWTDIRDFTSGSQKDTHLVAFQPGAGGYPITFKWSKEEIIKKYGGVVKLGKNPGNWADMKTNDSLIVTNTNTKELFIITEKPIIPILYEPGWNLVSLPVTVVDGRKEILFPNANSHAFIYNPIIGYDEKDTLVPGIGYWLKFPTIFLPFTMEGIPRTEDTIDVTEGWNLIGTLSESISPNTVGSMPPNVITSDFFGYKNTYYFADSLEPLKAYWVKVNQDGKLIFSTGSYITATNRIRIIPTLELPPLPPDQASTSTSRYIPENFSIAQNYPNPFNPTTKIKYELKKDIEVSLNIFDVLSRNVATLVNSKQPVGQHEVTWNADGFSSGVYYYRLVVGDYIETKK